MKFWNVQCGQAWFELNKINYSTFYILKITKNSNKEKKKNNDLKVDEKKNDNENKIVNVIKDKDLIENNENMSKKVNSFVNAVKNNNNLDLDEEDNEMEKFSDILTQIKKFKLRYF